MKWFIIAAILLLPGVCQAQVWYSTAGATSGTACTMQPGRVCYYDFADTTDSAMLATSQCGKVDVHLNPDEDGTNTGAEIQVYKCQESASTPPTTVPTHCLKVLADTDGDGIRNDVTLDGSTIMRKGIVFTAGKVWIDVTANAGSDDARVEALCVP